MISANKIYYIVCIYQYTHIFALHVGVICVQYREKKTIHIDK